MVIKYYITFIICLTSVYGVIFQILLGDTVILNCWAFSELLLRTREVFLKPIQKNNVGHELRSLQRTFNS